MDRQYEGRWQGERLIRLDIDENSDVLIGPTKYGWIDTRFWVDIDAGLRNAIKIYTRVSYKVNAYIKLN